MTIHDFPGLKAMTRLPWEWIGVYIGNRNWIKIDGSSPPGRVQFMDLNEVVLRDEFFKKGGYSHVCPKPCSSFKLHPPDEGKIFFQVAPDIHLARPGLQLVVEFAGDLAYLEPLAVIDARLDEDLGVGGKTG